jgi:tetratricopeptide (TPR) repeat protein
MMYRSPQFRASSRQPSFLTLVLVLAFASVAAQQSSKQIPSPARVTDQSIQFFQAQLARDPDYYLNYNRLASAYVQKARETGDISYYELAEKALKKSLDLESQHAEAAAAFSQIGGVQFAEHRFAEAAASAEHATKLEPGDTAGWALAGDAQLEMGNYAEAEAMFKKLVPADEIQPHHGTDYLSTTRHASLAWMRGDVDSAISLMTQSTLLAGQAGLPAENQAWTQFMLGEQLFQSGDLPKAEAAMKASLAAYPGYHRAVAGMGQIRAAQLRFAEAAEYYKQAIDVIPLPVYAAALGDIDSRLGKKSDAEKQYALVEYIGQLSVLNKQVYNRELALFYADHDRRLDQALTLAQKELEVRHDVSTWDALAWALLKNGRTQDAGDAMKKAMAQGTRDPLLFFHAAAVEHRLGNARQSGNYAREAIAMNPQFHPLFADQARQWLPQTAQSNLRGDDAKR